MIDLCILADMYTLMSFFVESRISRTAAVNLVT
jgi:hypothetical protein